jgi:hypothetical protein
MSTGDDVVVRRYQDGTYLAQNPTWDRADSFWKAELVRDILLECNIAPLNLCEVGCGAGDVLVYLSAMFPHATVTGFDISQDAATFWAHHRERNITFCCADFLTVEERSYDCLLLLDVVEHLANPVQFLTSIRERAKSFVFHIPLDLSAVSVLRGTPLLRQRRTVGHIHYFTKDLALELLRETGFNIIRWRYTDAWRTGPTKHGLTRYAAIPRGVFNIFSKDFGARLLGGQTLIALAQR